MVQPPGSLIYTYLSPENRIAVVDVKSLSQGNMAATSCQGQMELSDKSPRLNSKYMNSLSLISTPSASGLYQTYPSAPMEAFKKSSTFGFRKPGIKKKSNVGKLNRNRTYKTSYSNDDLAQAVKLVKSRNLRAYEASKIYNIPHTTLQNHLLGKVKKDVNVVRSKKDNIMKAVHSIIKFGMPVSKASRQFGIAHGTLYYHVKDRYIKSKAGRPRKEKRDELKNKKGKRRKLSKDRSITGSRVTDKTNGSKAQTSLEVANRGSLSDEQGGDLDSTTKKKKGRPPKDISFDTAKTCRVVLTPCTTGSSSFTSQMSNDPVKQIKRKVGRPRKESDNLLKTEDSALCTSMSDGVQGLHSRHNQWSNINSVELVPQFSGNQRESISDASPIKRKVGRPRKENSKRDPDTLETSGVSDSDRPSAFTNVNDAKSEPDSAAWNSAVDHNEDSPVKRKVGRPRKEGYKHNNMDDQGRKARISSLFQSESMMDGDVSSKSDVTMVTDSVSRKGQTEANTSISLIAKKKGRPRKSSDVLGSKDSMSCDVASKGTQRVFSSQGESFSEKASFTQDPTSLSYSKAKSLSDVEIQSRSWSIANLNGKKKVGRPRKVPKAGRPRKVLPTHLNALWKKKRKEMKVLSEENRPMASPSKEKKPRGRPKKSVEIRFDSLDTLKILPACLQQSISCSPTSAKKKGRGRPRKSVEINVDVVDLQRSPSGDVAEITDGASTPVKTIEKPKTSEESLV